MKMSFTVSFLIFIGTTASAEAPNYLIRTAKAVKALYDQARPLPAIVDVQPAEIKSLPPKQCIMVIYERKPNLECPDDPMIGPNFDRGYGVCFDSSTGEVDSIRGVETPSCR